MSEPAPLPPTKGPGDHAAALALLEKMESTPQGAAVLAALRAIIARRMAAREAAPVMDEDSTLLGRTRNNNPQLLFRRLERNPYGFDLFQAMRLIESVFPDKPRIGEAKRPRDEPVRFAQEVALAFATSAIAGFDPTTRKALPRLRQNVFGLFGPNGPMPLHLSEHVRDRERNYSDPTLARFADVFHHRLISLFYRGWRSSQPVVSLDRPGADRFGDYIGSLMGIGQKTLHERDSVPDFAKLAHAGALGRHVKSAEGLRVVLANFFAVDVSIEQWSEHWMRIPESQWTRIGVKTGFAVLGQEAVIGERVWDRQSKFTIVIGPLTYAQYQRFLPSGKSYAKLRDFVRLYIGHELAWQVRLILKKDEVPYAWLGNSVWLGWSSWLGVRLGKSDASDLELQDRNFATGKPKSTRVQDEARNGFRQLGTVV